MRKLKLLLLFIPLLACCSLNPYYYFDYLSKNLDNMNTVIVSPPYRTLKECELIREGIKGFGYTIVSECYNPYTKK